ncbi:MAG TPA: leucine--tRNA ligase [Polyangia bacterium]|jgi:leucyl-tRNA synthetase
MDERYDPQAIEPKWQKVWAEADVFRAAPHAEKPKCYVLEMFPYPSGRLHMGHVRNYSIGDVIARVRRMQGYSVLYPIGWDAFGLPAENAAIKAGIHPRQFTYDNIANMRRQLKRMGFSYDWARELATCHPLYYKWEQKLFIEMFRRGLAYRKGAVVNWCPKCNTVLANEQVVDGCCWRHEDTQVVQKELTQWFLRITAYGEELLAGLDRLTDAWPERVLTMQRNWIGKSQGAEITFALEQPLPEQAGITVFTTRPDTLYGATFMSIAAEHPLAQALARGTPHEAAVAAFAAHVAGEDKVKRARDEYEKEGVFTGGYCLNPVTGRKMPIYAANFVLAEYGTGAVMAVPAHDQRDFEFARKYGLDIVPVIQPPPGPPLDPATMTAAYVEPGVMTDSGPFDGTPSEEGKRKVTEYLAQGGYGKETISWRLRDWLVSRQRYWGAPIPMIHCPACGIVPEKEENLPVKLPDDVDFKVAGSPLAEHPTWAQVSCPQCGGAARRDTDTFDTFVESSWYFARYCTPRDDEHMLGPEAKTWLPVDQYIGGIEHAVMHLLYARFFTRVLRDAGLVDVDEPFARLLTQGMVCKETYRCPEHDWLYPEEVEGYGKADAPKKCARCGRDAVIGPVVKMSKSLKNVIDPDALVARYGADTMRVFMLFTSPPENNLEWSDAGVEGASRFLGRLYRLVAQHVETVKSSRREKLPAVHPIRRAVHKTLQRVTQDTFDRFHFNTAIAGIMELLNTLGGFTPQGEEDAAALREAVETAVLMVAPFAPHLAEELWEALGNRELVAVQPWPSFDPELARDEKMVVVVQVNGKLRGQIEVAPDASEDEVKAAALAEPNVVKHMAGKAARKVVFVRKPNSCLVNVVV